MLLRRVLVAALAVFPACSLFVETSDLAGGPPRVDAVSDGATARADDTGTPTLIVPDAGTTSPDAALDANVAPIPSCGVIRAGTEIPFDEYIYSCNRKYHVVLQHDGNLCAYGPDSAVWATETYDKPVASARMQADGDLQVLGPKGEVRFSSGTKGFPTAYFEVGDDGVMRIFADGVKRWQGVP